MMLEKTGAVVSTFSVSVTVAIRVDLRCTMSVNQSDHVVLADFQQAEASNFASESPHSVVSIIETEIRRCPALVSSSVVH